MEQQRGIPQLRHRRVGEDPGGRGHRRRLVQSQRRPRAGLGVAEGVQGAGRAVGRLPDRVRQDLVRRVGLRAMAGGEGVAGHPVGVGEGLNPRPDHGRHRVRCVGLAEQSHRPRREMARRQRHAQGRRRVAARVQERSGHANTAGEGVGHHRRRHRPRRDRDPREHRYPVPCHQSVLRCDVGTHR